MHDHLLYLKSPLHDHFAAQPLRKLLVEEGILERYSPPINSTEIRGEIARIFKAGDMASWKFGFPGMSGTDFSPLSQTDNLSRSLTQEAYNIIAKGFSATIEELKRVNAPFEITIPPLTALCPG